MKFTIVNGDLPTTDEFDGTRHFVGIVCPELDLETMTALLGGPPQFHDTDEEYPLEWTLQFEDGSVAKVYCRNEDVYWLEDTEYGGMLRQSMTNMDPDRCGDPRLPQEYSQWYVGATSADQLTKLKEELRVREQHPDRVRERQELWLERHRWSQEDTGGLFRLERVGVRDMGVCFDPIGLGHNLVFNTYVTSTNACEYFLTLREKDGVQCLVPTETGEYGPIPDEMRSNTTHCGIVHNGKMYLYCSFRSTREEGDEAQPNSTEASLVIYTIDTDRWEIRERNVPAAVMAKTGFQKTVMHVYRESLYLVQLAHWGVSIDIIDDSEESHVQQKWVLCLGQEDAGDMFVYSDSCLHVVVSSFSSKIDRVQRHFTYHPDTGWVDSLCPRHSQMPLLDTPRYIQSGKALLVYSADIRVSHTVPKWYDTGTEIAHCVLDIVSGDVYRGVEIHDTQRVEHLCPVTPSTYLTQVNDKWCLLHVNHALVQSVAGVVSKEDLF
ncbi:hypothetical protein KIPB_000940 [Kipferlia bialata]|uniref:Uncharacterized protein n=1 Tax=Kipferlia bialata TaxID=797122 RepID=A0A9K3CPY5_9EUKA|nr:hypothetical protein KIPB_000940 [Kipferlia bialata]|eukprot:g940.t1